MNVCVVSFPYTVSQSTGRGLDRYSYQLTENIASECKNVSIRLVDRGSLGSAAAVVKKMPGFLGSLFAERPDVYHAMTPQGGAVLAGLGRTPLVVTIHDVIPLNVDAKLDSPQKYWLWRHMLRICLRRSDAVIVPYQVTKDEIVERLGGDPSKIFVVNYGVDHTKYYRRPELPRVPNRVVYLGEVSRSKGVDVLMRAFALVKETVPSAELVIAGKPSQDEQMLRELGDSLRVKDMTLGGFISEEELPSYYATASTMVFPSRCGFGLSTLEAMACGTPVVVARVLDAPEFIGDAGLLAEPDSPEDLAKQLIRTLTDGELRAELSEKAVRRAQEFSWARMARETVKVYEEVLRRRFS
jgi:glycosyltransferase involved in cell wall biosynthesis